MIISLVIANILTVLAFFVHTFAGDKEIRLLEPKEGPALKLLGRWVMARCGWHWVSLDLLLASVFLLYVNLNSPEYYPTDLLLMLSVYFGCLAIVWLITVTISRRFPKNYLNLGQWILLLTIALLVFFGGTARQYTPNKSVVDAYYQTYKERTAWNEFLEFYADDVVLEDFIGGYKIEGKEAFAEFFNWDDERFKKGATNALEIVKQDLSGNTVTTQGYFTPFSWGETQVEAMQFTTILEFNEDGKIIKHTDWINYPDYLIDYSQRVNSNDWIE